LPLQRHKKRRAGHRGVAYGKCGGRDMRNDSELVRRNGISLKRMLSAGESDDRICG
jgi:hypothetical protein